MIQHMPDEAAAYLERYRWTRSMVVVIGACLLCVAFAVYFFLWVPPVNQPAAARLGAGDSALHRGAAAARWRAPHAWRARPCRLPRVHRAGDGRLCWRGAEITAWVLDRDRLAKAVAGVAPGVPIEDAATLRTAVQAIRSLGRHQRVP